MMRPKTLVSFLNNQLFTSDLKSDIEAASELALKALSGQDQGFDAEKIDLDRLGYDFDKDACLFELCRSVDFTGFARKFNSERLASLKEQYAVMLNERLVTSIAKTAGVDNKKAFLAFTVAYRYFRMLIDSRLKAFELVLSASYYIDHYHDDCILHLYFNAKDLMAYKGFMAMAIDLCSYDQNSLLDSI